MAACHPGSRDLQLAVGAIVFLGAGLSSRDAGAEGATEPGNSARSVERENAASLFKPRDCESFCYIHWIAGLGIGRGLRFNNPFRLATTLGNNAESLSLTATYTDFGVGVALGDPNGVQQGLSINVSLALQGVPQEVIAPGYLMVYRASSRVSYRARVSAPVVVEPDLNIGGEVAFGIAYLLWTGVGVYADLVASGYQGAATDQVAVTWVPLASAQLGVAFDYEILP